MIYQEDPYVKVYPIKKDVYALFEKNADDVGSIWMYLLVGSQRAMLIDTSFGVGDLKKLCDMLSGGKPLIVVNTHAHPDHCYGNCRFDTVYCHPYSIPDLQTQQEHMWDRLLDEDGKGIWQEFTKDALPKFQKYHILACEDGMVFDLGNGWRIEAIDTPGHHSGHICFLDQKNKLLFAGDSICSEEIHIEGPWKGQLYPECSTLRAYAESLKKLEARKEWFDEIYPSHDRGGLKNTVIGQIQRALQEIMEAPDSYDRKEVLDGQNRYFKKIKDLGYLVYRNVQ